MKTKLKKLNENDNEFTQLKALQIADGVAKIYYLVDQEKLVVQIKEIFNYSQVNFKDFRAVVKLLNYGEIYHSITGPNFNLDAKNVLSYDKEFAFDLAFDNVSLSSVIIQIEGTLDNKNVVASRVFIQQGNFDIIYSSANKFHKIINNKATLK